MHKRVLGLIAALLLPIAGAKAADHADGPAAKADPASDITDVFAWMSADKANVYLVMDVSPASTTTSKFSNVTQYIFHTSSLTAYGATPSATTNIICTFDTAQKISCWVGNESFVRGDASATSGLTSNDGKVKVFAGLRNDPFFFNLNGFKDAAADVHANAGALVAANAFDGSGCPDLTKSPAGSAMTYQQILFADLTHTSHGAMPPTDAFKGQNVLSIVLSVDKTLLLQGGGPILSVWGSTNH
jgi:hypothetical protein